MDLKVYPCSNYYYEERKKQLKYNLVRTRTKDGKTFQDILKEMMK
jgi:hypothetical protein